LNHGVNIEPYIHTYIHTRNSSGRTAKMAGIHRGPLRGPERFVTQHAQSAENELHTSGGKGGRGQRRDTRQHFCDRRAVALRAAHCSRQGTRARGAQPHRRAYDQAASGGVATGGQRRDTRQHFCDSRAVALRAAQPQQSGYARTGSAASSAS